MYCPYCGAQNIDDARFCMNCGKAVPGAAPAPPPEPVLPDNQAAPEAEAVGGRQDIPAPCAPAAPKAGPVAAGTEQVPNYLVPAIVVTGLSFILGCCFPLGWIFGIVAISYAARANSLLAACDYSGAAIAAKSAKTWCWVSVVCGVGLPLVLLSLSHVFHFMPRSIPHMRHFMSPFHPGRII
jgi:hypothetical protein